MNEIQNKFFEKTKYSNETSIDGLDNEKIKLLKSYKNFEIFTDIMKNNQIITQDEKEKVLLILNNIDIGDLQYFFNIGFTLIDENGIRNFIENNISILETKKTGEETKKTGEETKKTGKEIEYFKKGYIEVRNTLLKLTEDDKELKIIVDKLDLFYNGYTNIDLNIVIDELGNYLSKNNNAIKIFKKLQDTPNEYSNLYNFLQNSGNSKISQILETIPKSSEEFKHINKRTNKIINNAYFPDIYSENIKTIGYVLETKINDTTSKIVNLKDIPPRTYIVGINNYKIETQTISSHILDMRATFTKERIRIGNEIENNLKQIGNYNKMLIGKNIDILLKELEDLKNKNPKNLEDESKIFDLKYEINILNGIKEKIKNLEEKNKNLKEELLKKEDEFLYYFSKKISLEKEQIKYKDNKAQNTIEFLDNLGLTNINQDDLQKILNRININPQAYGFSKKVNLEYGFEGSATDTLKQKKEFFNFFSKIYKKMNFDPPISENIVEGFIKDPRLKQDASFKQKLEDIGIMRGGNLQLEIFFKIINEKQEKNMQENI